MNIVTDGMTKHCDKLNPHCEILTLATLMLGVQSARQELLLSGAILQLMLPSTEYCGTCGRMPYTQLPGGYENV